MQRFAHTFRLASAGLSIAVAGCGGDLTLPGTTGTGQGFDLSVVAGNDQTGTVGEPLPNPLVIEVRGTDGLPVAGRAVAFVPQSDGTFTPDTATTDNQGRAESRWVLGTATGNYTAVVRLVDAGDSAVPPVPVSAAAVAGEPDSLRGVSGMIQGGQRDQTLSQPLVVIVVDRFGNPVADVKVSWKLQEGAGKLSAKSTQTGGDGQTSVTWTLGDRSGVQHVSAVVDGLSGSPVNFIATVLF